MKVRHLIVPIFLVLLVCVPATGKDKWVNLTTRNFNIVSNADEGDTRELAQKLEQFRLVFSQLFNTTAADSVPVTVMVFKSDDSFTPFKPLYNGKPANLAGYFQPGKDENVIALNISGNELRPMALIFHEYTHLLTSFSSRQWPAWLMEGIAELYSTFTVKKNDVTLGAPVSSHVYLLRDSRLMPLPSLFEVSRTSPEYNEGKKQGVFYAQSWALAHYLMFGDKSVRQPQLVKFLSLLMSGASSDQAFSEAFKTDYASMEKELRRYVGRDSYSAMTYTLTNTQADNQVSVRPLAEAEVQFYLGNLLFRTRRPDEAEAYFKKAAELDPAIAGPHEGLGFLAIERNKFSEAKEQFKLAASLGSKNHLARYYYAEALHREALGHDGGRSLNPEVVKTIVDELKLSIKLMPNFAYSYNLLGFVRLLTGENLEEGVQMMNKAMQLDPQNKHFALALAQLQVRMQDYAAAKKTLEPLLAVDDDSSVKTSAASLMAMIESNSRRPTDPADETPTASPSNDAASRPQLIRKGTESQAETPEAGEAEGAGPNSRPSLKLEGAETIGGLLARIECHDGMVLALKSGEKLLRYSVSDVAKLQFFSQDPEFKGNIGCGPINLRAYIYFKPASEQARFAGDAVAVEFVK
jgi:tetratricopeptide (TPR) repeat protein